MAKALPIYLPRDIPAVDRRAIISEAVSDVGARSVRRLG
jgi:uncharacterized protein YqeY